MASRSVGHHGNGKKYVFTCSLCSYFKSFFASVNRRLAHLYNDIHSVSSAICDANLMGEPLMELNPSTHFIPEL